MLAHTTQARRRRAARGGRCTGRRGHRSACRSVSVYSMLYLLTHVHSTVPYARIKPYKVRSLDCAQHIQTERHISNSQSHFARAACRCLIDCSSRTCHSVAGRK